MGAPLYSRFRRYFDRDAKTLGEPRLKQMLIKAKNRARVYALDERAAREAGKLAAMPPSKLRAILEAVYLPSEHVWVELPWEPFISGASEGIGLPFMPTEHPSRVGFLVSATQAGDFRNFGVVTYYLLPSKGSMLGPHIAEVNQVPQVRPAIYDKFEKDFQAMGVDVNHTGTGFGYAARYRDHEPAALKWLSSRLDLMVLRGGLPNFQKWQGLLQEVNGTARQALCVIGIVCAAKSRRYRISEVRDPAVRGPSGEGRVSLISMYTDVDASGIAARKAIMAIERARHRYHEVSGHYSYRQRADGQDPRFCYVGTQTGSHMFEATHGHSEECMICGQHRWFRAEHHRGDPTLGSATPKVRLIHGRAEGV